MEPKFKEITLMNSILCLCVVMIHLTSAPLESLTVGTFWHSAIFVINKILCFSVPAFIFLSGLKLYNKYSNAKIELKRFYLGRFKKIVIPYIICVLIYFRFFYLKSWVSLDELPQFIFFGTLAAHFYYIIIAVQLYLIFPILKKLVNKNTKLILIVSLISTVCCHEVFAFNYIDRFFATYIFYFVLGMIFAKYRIWEKVDKFRILCVAGVIIVGPIHFYLVYLSSTTDFIYRIAESLNILYVTLAIFSIYSICVMLNDKWRVLHVCANAISRKSFSIYLYHIYVIFWLQYDIYPEYGIVDIGNKFIISCSVVFLLIFIYSLIRLPKLNKHIK